MNKTVGFHWPMGRFPKS